MKGETLMKMWGSYLSDKKVDLSKMDTSKSEMALLFGAGDCILDHQRGKVKFPKLGWLKVKGVGQDMADPDWLAVIGRQGADVSRIVMGRGSPFADGMESVLPSEDGILLALPSDALDS